MQERKKDGTNQGVNTKRSLYIASNGQIGLRSVEGRKKDNVCYKD